VTGVDGDARMNGAQQLMLVLSPTRASDLRSSDFLEENVVQLGKGNLGKYHVVRRSPDVESSGFVKILHVR